MLPSPEHRPAAKDVPRPPAEAETAPVRPAFASALDRPGARASAWAHLLFVDHGLLRLVYLNAHRVGPHLWRAAQPAPHDLARFKRHGVRTVLCIRAGVQLPGLDLEREACARLGLRLIELKIRGRAAPKRAEMLELIALFRSIAYPALVHCKSGADRTGLVAAVYRIVVEGHSARAAMGELSLRYGHLEGSPAGILDAFLEAFAREGEARGLDFETWVRDHYDRDRLTAAFKARPWTTWLAEKVFRREL